LFIVDRHKQLLVGDTLIEVNFITNVSVVCLIIVDVSKKQLNGVNVEAKSHDEVVQMLKAAGEKCHVKVKHHKEMAAILKKSK